MQSLPDSSTSNPGDNNTRQISARQCYFVLTMNSTPEPPILWLRMTRGSGKLCWSLAKIWLFGTHGACSVRKWSRYLTKQLDFTLTEAGKDSNFKLKTEQKSITETIVSFFFFTPFT